LLSNLGQIYWRFKHVWQNLINSLKFLFALTFQNMNLYWHHYMENIYRFYLIWLEIKEELNCEFEFKLNQVHLTFNHCRYMMENCRLHRSGYSDTMGVTYASFQTDTHDSKSQFGFVFCLNGGT
jgi:hypothetical protein